MRKARVSFLQQRTILRLVQQHWGCMRSSGGCGRRQRYRPLPHHRHPLSRRRARPKLLQPQWPSRPSRQQPRCVRPSARALVSGHLVCALSLAPAVPCAICSWLITSSSMPHEPPLSLQPPCVCTLPAGGEFTQWRMPPLMRLSRRLRQRLRRADGGGGGVRGDSMGIWWSQLHASSTRGAAAPCNAPWRLAQEASAPELNCFSRQQRSAEGAPRYAISC